MHPVILLLLSSITTDWVWLLIPDDEHVFARNTQMIKINVLYKRTVRQVGHLPEVISRYTVSKT